MQRTSRRVRSKGALVCCAVTFPASRTATRFLRLTPSKSWLGVWRVRCTSFSTTEKNLPRRFPIFQSAEPTKKPHGVPRARMNKRFASFGAYWAERRKKTARFLYSWLKRWRNHVEPDRADRRFPLG